MTRLTYTLETGNADVERLRILNDHYNPSSRALLESAGVKAGDRVIDVGCGHGAMTEWLAQRVGEQGKVYAVDSSQAQLDVARARLARYSHVELICAHVEDPALSELAADCVYSRFVLMHLADPRAAIAAMGRMLAPGGQLITEVGDVTAQRFVPGDPAADLWRGWWFRLGEALGASYDVSARAEALLREAGFAIERMDEFQPVSSRREAKLLHALGFEQLIPAYIKHGGADVEQVERHLEFLRRVVPDASVRIALYRVTQYVARLGQ